MERPILFRAKNEDEKNLDWYYGYLFVFKSGKKILYYELEDEIHVVAIKDETLCQLFHQHGELQIFEGDVIKFGKNSTAEYLVYWDPFAAGFSLKLIDGEETTENSDFSTVKIVRNVIDSEKK